MRNLWNDLADDLQQMRIIEMREFYRSVEITERFKTTDRRLITSALVVRSTKTISMLNLREIYEL